MAMAMSADPGPVAGYAWPQSVVPGETFALHLTNATAEREVLVEIARVGAEREVVFTTTARVDDHPYPEGFTADGCDWPAALEVTAGEDWRSGFYEIALISAGVLVSRAFVVVRALPGAEAGILLALSTNTWNAYNDVHNQLSLYTGANVVSFARPMSPGFLHKPHTLGWRLVTQTPPDRLRAAHTGYKVRHGFSDWCGCAGWANWEHPFAVWAERAGYRIDYATNADLERGADWLAPYRLLLSVGHDEYWSAPMRDAVEQFGDRGGNVAFLSGNTSFWQVRLEGSGTAMIAYKYGFEKDPVYGTDRERELTSIWSDRVAGRPENAMTGVSFCRGGYARTGVRVPDGSGGYTIQREDHWLLEGTGLSYGDLLGAESAVVGYECDGCAMQLDNGLPVPTGEDGTPPDFEIVATSPAQPFDRVSVSRPIPDDQPSEIEFIAWRALGDMSPETQVRVAHNHCVMGAFRRGEAGGTTVTVGCTEWAHGLAGASPRVEQVTRNILDRLGPGR